MSNFNIDSKAENWQTFTLMDVCDMYQPKTISKKDLELDGAYPVFGANGIIGQYSKYNHENPQLLITCRGATCGSVNISLPKSWINGNAMVIKPKSNDISIDFLKYFFEGVCDFSRVITGAAQPQITRKSLSPIQITVPPIGLQNKIVSQLDRAFEAIDQAIANTEKNIENLDELERSHLNGIFDTVSTESVLKYLPEISENLDRQRIPITKRDRVNGEIPYYGASGIVDYVSDHLFDERLLCISEDGANLLARKYPIAFQISGKTWVNNHAHVLRFKDIHLERFVMHYLNHIKLDSFISGMAQPKLNQAKLNKIPIPIPKIRKVEEICLKIERLNVLTSEMRMVQTEKLESMKQLKMSILEKAFKGELV